MATLEFAYDEPVRVTVRLGLKDASGPALGLTTVELIVMRPSTGAKVSLTTKYFSAVNAVDMPGVYRISVPVIEWPEFGIYPARVNPNNAAVDDPEEFTIERVYGEAPAVAPPGTPIEPTPLTLEQRRAALIARRESLVTKVAAGDKSVDYDLTAVGEALAQLDREIALAAGGKTVRQVRAIAGKGL